jgi:hypothetical protein
MKPIISKLHSISIMRVCKNLSIAVILFFALQGTARAGSTAHKDPSFVGAENFKHQFPDATNISYKVKGEFTEVNFIWNAMRLQAFFDHDGNLLATCRPIGVGDLSLSAQLSLRDQYPGYVEREAIEYNDADAGVSYYVTMVGPKTSYLLCVSTGGQISVFKKMKP